MACISDPHLLSIRMASVQRGKDNFNLSNGPRPAAGEARLVSLDHKAAGNGSVITAKYDGNLKSVVWRVRANGWMDCECVCSSKTGQMVSLGRSVTKPDIEKLGPVVVCVASISMVVDRVNGFCQMVQSII